MFEILQHKTKYYALHSSELYMKGKLFYINGNNFIQTDDAIKRLQREKIIPGLAQFYIRHLKN
jgi:hypothetical protein